MRTLLAVSLLFIGLVGSAHAQPAPRQRLEVFDDDPARVAALKRGVAAMKSRRPSDPTSWFFQAAIHGVTDEAVAEAAVADPAVNQVDRARYWNQCPHFAALRSPSADFVIWHRAYLYHFERILRAASGDPSLSLPYWNYTEPGHRGFPPLFADSEEDANRRPTNPLYDPRREAAFMGGLLDLGEGAVDHQTAFAAVNFFDSPASNAFAGGHDDREPGSQGRLERSPHNGIHFAIGGFIAGTPPNQGTAGLMSSVETAASDPVFWVHHANVDRLAQVWACLPGRKWGRAPRAAWFQARPWWFHDADGRPYNHPRAHYVSARNLGLRFDTDTASCAALTDTLPAVGPGPAGVEGPAALTAEVAASRGPLKLSATKPTSVEVRVAGRVLDSSDLGAAMRKAGARRRQTVLNLLGVDYDRPPRVAYDVFVDAPADAVLGRNDPRFVGTLALFGLKHAARDDHAAHGNGGGASNSFDITKLVKSRNAAAGPLRITLVPRSLYAARPGAAGVASAPAEGNVVIERVTVVAVEDN